MTARLEMYVGSMFAEKSTNLIRQGKRHLLAGRKVVFLKPEIDGRYADDAVVTHDGVEHKAISVNTHMNRKTYFMYIPEIVESDVVCIDEVQFFNKGMVYFINDLLKMGKRVYVAGLDMDRFGKPFGIVPHLMAIAEKVTKVHAVCTICGEDAYRTLGIDSTKETNNQVVIGNDYVPVCRKCTFYEGV